MSMTPSFDKSILDIFMSVDDNQRERHSCQKCQNIVFTEPKLELAKYIYVNNLKFDHVTTQQPTQEVQPPKLIAKL